MAQGVQSVAAEELAFIERFCTGNRDLEAGATISAAERVAMLLMHLYRRVERIGIELKRCGWSGRHD